MCVNDLVYYRPYDRQLMSKCTLFHTVIICESMQTVFLLMHCGGHLIRLFFLTTVCLVYFCDRFGSQFLHPLV